MVYLLLCFSSMLCYFSLDTLYENCWITVWATDYHLGKGPGQPWLVQVRAMQLSDWKGWSLAAPLLQLIFEGWLPLGGTFFWGFLRCGVCSVQFYPQRWVSCSFLAFVICSHCASISAITDTLWFFFFIFLLCVYFKTLIPWSLAWFFLYWCLYCYFLFSFFLLLTHVLLYGDICKRLWILLVKTAVGLIKCVRNI